MSNRTPNPARAFVAIQPPIGSRVKMSAFGKATYFNRDVNPHTLQGTVYTEWQPEIIDATRTSELDVDVKWDNGKTNSYNIAHLDIVSIPFKVGDRVALSALGMKIFIDYPDNPHDTAGTIAKSSKLYDDRFIVDWDNERFNGYSSIELMPIKMVTSMPKKKKPANPIILPSQQKLTVRPEFLKAAYKAACLEWKEKLAKEYPDFEFVRKERTYKSGETICINTAWGPTDYVIVHSDRNTIILVNKTSFLPWTTAIAVANHNDITVAELNKIVGASTTWHGKVTDL